MARTLRSVKFVFLMTCIVFIVTFFIGGWLACHKPLWNDEIYTQIFSIDSKSYLDILSMRIFEGNSCPLFYLSQKAIVDVFHYKFPFKQGKPYVFDNVSQLVLRLCPDLCMSLSLAIIFYFFSTQYSLVIGFYSLLSALVSPMVWLYWAEARPYAMWFLLTTVQSFLFILILKTNRCGSLSSLCAKDRHLWISLIITHFLLSFTILLSLAQILIVTFLLWVFHNRSTRRYLWVGLFPSAVCLCYYVFSAAPLRRYSVGDPMGLILTAFPVDKLILLVVFLLMFALLPSLCNSDRFSK